MSAETTLIGTLLCMFGEQKIPKNYLNHSILEKICFYVSNERLKMVGVIC